MATIKELQQEIDELRDEVTDIYVNLYKEKRVLRSLLVGEYENIESYAEEEFEEIMKNPNKKSLRKEYGESQSAMLTILEEAESVNEDIEHMQEVLEDEHDEEDEEFKEFLKKHKTDNE